MVDKARIAIAAVVRRYHDEQNVRAAPPWLGTQAEAQRQASSDEPAPVPATETFTSPTESATQKTPSQVKPVAEIIDLPAPACLRRAAPAPFQDLLPYHYRAILADPPWHFKTYSEKGRNRNPDWRRFEGSPCRHYETMSLADIAALPVTKIVAADCVLFLWIIWPMLPQALALIVDWGFRYKTLGFDWMKARPGELPQMGLGYWTRSSSEVCLLATRGKPSRLHADVRAGIIEPRREHSRKPDCVHDRIERLVDGPYLELFARHPRAGWTVWGDQVP